VIDRSVGNRPITTNMRWICTWLLDEQRDEGGFVLAGLSAFTMVTCGNHQGSVLGPILFIMDTPDLMRNIECYDLLSHLFANDTHVYGRCSQSGIDVSRRVQMKF